MRWQDAVFTGGSLVFLAALIPMLRGTVKPPLSSTVPVAAVLYVFSFTYLTLHFVLAPRIEFVQASMWAALAWQKWRHDRFWRGVVRWYQERGIPAYVKLKWPK